MTQPTPVSSAGDEMIFDSSGKPIPSQFPIEWPQATESGRDVFCYHIEILHFDGRELRANPVKTILADEIKALKGPVRVEFDDLPSAPLTRFAEQSKHARSPADRKPDTDEESATETYLYWRITALYGEALTRGPAKTSVGASHIFKIRSRWQPRQRGLRAETAT